MSWLWGGWALFKGDCPRGDWLQSGLALRRLALWELLLGEMGSKGDWTLRGLALRVMASDKIDSGELPLGKIGPGEIGPGRGDSEGDCL